MNASTGMTTTETILASTAAQLNRKAAQCGVSPSALLTALVIDGLKEGGETIEPTAKQACQEN